MVERNYTVTFEGTTSVLSSNAVFELITKLHGGSRYAVRALISYRGLVHIGKLELYTISGKRAVFTVVN